MVAPELAFAENVRDLLKPMGEARLEYITAELQPFSNQQRPDVVFVPRLGGYTGQTIFIEIKLSTKPIGSARGFQNLVENRAFAAEALDSQVARFVYVTSELVPEFSKKHLEQEGVQVLDGVGSETEVVAYLGRLASSSFSKFESYQAALSSL